MEVPNNGSFTCISIGDLSGSSEIDILFGPVIPSMRSIISSLISSMSYAPVSSNIACDSGSDVDFLYENTKLLLGGLPRYGSDLTLGQL